MPTPKGTREAALKAIEKLERMEPKGPKSAVRALLPKIAELHAEKGFSFVEIAEVLAGQGVDVQPQTIWRYLTDEYGPKLRKAAKVYSFAVPGDIHEAIVLASETSGKEEREIIIDALRHALLTDQPPAQQKGQMSLLLDADDESESVVKKPARGRPKTSAKKPVKTSAKIPKKALVKKVAKRA